MPEKFSWPPVETRMPNQKTPPKKSLAELVQVLDDGTTLADILTGFGWWQAEKKRSVEKGKRIRAAKKAARAVEPPAPTDDETGSVNINE